MTVDVLKLYRRIVKLQKAGLSQSEIGAVCGIQQWTVSRILRIGGMVPAFRSVLGGSGVATLAALVEIASWPQSIQRAALPGILKIVATRGGRTIRRSDVAPVMARHGRDLDRAPFPTTACRACVKRTGAQQDFFGYVAPGELGRCNDAACFARNTNAVAARRARLAGKRQASPTMTSARKKGENK